MEQKEGIFASTLKRNFKDIREERAGDIIEASEIKYRRTVEDVKLTLSKLNRQRNALLDLSPGTTQSLKFEPFDEEDFVKEDVDLCIKIHNTSEKLKILKARYEQLFGEAKWD